MRYFIILFFAVLLCENLSAQSLKDTIQLEEVVASGNYYRYQAGIKIDQINGELLNSVQVGGLEQILMRFTPIYIKSNAGGLSTIRIRGTAPDHTSIMFGGINVNSLTLGHSNLSNITSFMFDDLQLQYGSSSALNGSGAIGGAIYLGQKNNWTKGVNTSLRYTSGSFGERFYGAKAYLGNGKWESVTKILKYKSDNNFPYMNYFGFENQDGTRVIQNGAAIENKGILQQINYLFGPNEYFKSSFWYEDSWHEIQPNMFENDGSDDAVTELKNDNYRFWGEYLNENRKLKWHTGIGLVNDQQVYNNNQNQFIETKRAIIDLSVKHPINKKLEYKFGTHYKFISPNVYSYSNSVNLNEHNTDLYLVGFYQASKKIKTTLNLRQQFSSNFQAPFTPAIGLEYNLFETKFQFLQAKFNLSKSYRIPTFNDRYWPTAENPLGTPNLQPEDGSNAEIGFHYQLKSNETVTNFKLNLFYIDIKNWIEWRNKNGSFPINLEHVVSSGIEIHTDFELNIGNSKSVLIANYTYNPSIKYERGKPDQQIIYVPINMGNASYQFKHKDISLILDGSYTGKRYNDYISKSTQIRKSLEEYFLANFVISYHGFKFKKQSLICSFTSNNIFNKSYQNEIYYAMPGINFQASIQMNLNINNKY